MTDFSIGGLLVQAAEALEIGAVVHIALSTADDGPIGTFAMRCLHAHRTGADQGVQHISALVFVDALDERTIGTLTRLAAPKPVDRLAESRRHLRLAERPAD